MSKSTFGLRSESTDEPLLKAHELFKRFPEGDRQRTVLNGLSLNIYSGELIVLLGRSGSGKSTLLNLLGAMDRPDRGSITVSGTDIARMDEKNRTLFRRHHIGFVFQSFNLIPTLSVLENVLLPLQLKGTEMEQALDTSRKYLEETGLLDRADTFPDRLSGGEQQRVAIARALAHEPELILADEPTGNLDLETGRRVVDLLFRLAKKSGRTVLIATHDRDMCSFADHSYRFSDGKIFKLTGHSGIPDFSTDTSGRK